MVDCLEVLSMKLKVQDRVSRVCFGFLMRLNQRPDYIRINDPGEDYGIQYPENDISGDKEASWDRINCA